LAGDLNARTSNNSDFIIQDSGKHLPLSNTYTSDLTPVGRMSQDTTLNSRGKQLLALCVSSALRLLNGDILGTCTCHQPLGSIVVDYIAVSEDLVPLFTYFNVHDFHPDLSDHCQISCLLNCNFSTITDHRNYTKMPEKYIWSDNSAELFQFALNSNTVKDMIDKFKSKSYTMYTKDTINEAANDLRNVIIKAADMSLKKRKRGNGTKKRVKKKYPEWYDMNLSLMKRELNY
jgi:hypothetical protein